MLWLHEAQFPERPRTNLATVFQELGVEYPGDLHERFRNYGRDAGFTNSIFERYAFISEAVSNEVLKGQIIVLGERTPLTWRVRKFFEKLAYYYGPGRFFWLPMMVICLGGPLVIATVLAVWFVRRSRPKEE
jgi:hypothetical protein